MADSHGNICFGCSSAYIYLFTCKEAPLSPSILSLDGLAYTSRARGHRAGTVSTAHSEVNFSGLQAA